MLRDITIGQYYQADSVIHRLDPRVKLFATMIYIISLFLSDSLIEYLLITVCLAGVIIISKVPFKFIMRGLKAIFVILMISVFFNMCFTPGKVLYQFWFFKITKEGLVTAFFMGIRFVYLIIGSSILTLTTTPNNLTDGLEKSLGFLRIIRIPVHEIAMMMSIALRFIPILMDETDKIIKAQTARGADFQSGNILRRAKAMIPILVPLFISAFKRANDLATAMDARCYCAGAARTKMKPLRYRTRDYLTYGMAAIYIGSIITMRFVF